MASGGRLPSQPSAPGVRSEPRLGEAALGVPLPQPWWNPWLSGPSPGGPRAACPSLGAAPGPQLPRPPLQASTPRVPCDWRGPLDERRLVAHLQLALGREARLWRGGQPQAEICHRVQEVVSSLLGLQNIFNFSLLGLQNIFNFSQTTFNLALTTFSRLLVSVKIRERLLHCVMITSLRLAAKFNEEEELIPRVKDFIKHYGSGYTPGELRRIELAILDRLHWDLYIAMPLDFLTIFHALVVLGWPHLVELLPQRNPSLHVASLTRQLQHCMAGHQLLQFKGSTLALVIITLELERLMPDWCTPISDLLKKAQVSIEQLSHCKELVKQHLGSL